MTIKVDAFYSDKLAAPGCMGVLPGLVLGLVVIALSGNLLCGVVAAGLAHQRAEEYRPRGARPITYEGTLGVILAGLALTWLGLFPWSEIRPHVLPWMGCVVLPLVVNLLRGYSLAAVIVLNLAVGRSWFLAVSLIWLGLDQFKSREPKGFTTYWRYAASNVRVLVLLWLVALASAAAPLPPQPGWPPGVAGNLFAAALMLVPVDLATCIWSGAWYDSDWLRWRSRSWRLGLALCVSGGLATWALGWLFGVPLAPALALASQATLVGGALGLWPTHGYPLLLVALGAVTTTVLAWALGARDLAAPAVLALSPWLLASLIARSRLGQLMTRLSPPLYPEAEQRSRDRRERRGRLKGLGQPVTLTIDGQAQPLGHWCPITRMRQLLEAGYQVSFTLRWTEYSVPVCRGGFELARITEDREFLLLKGDPDVLGGILPEFDCTAWGSAGVHLRTSDIYAYGESEAPKAPLLSAISATTTGQRAGGGHLEGE